MIDEIKKIQEASRGEEVRDAIVNLFNLLRAGADTLEETKASKEELEAGLLAKQDTLVFDDLPTDDSDNPVTSKGIKKAIEIAKPNIVYDETPTEGSQNPVTSNGIWKMLDEFQPSVSFLFSFDSANDELTESNTSKKNLGLFKLLEDLISTNTMIDALYTEQDTPLKNEMNVKLYLSDFTSERFIFASNPYDGVQLQIIIGNDNSILRSAENLGMEVLG